MTYNQLITNNLKKYLDCNVNAIISRLNSSNKTLVPAVFTTFAREIINDANVKQIELPLEKVTTDTTSIKGKPMIFAYYKEEFVRRAHDSYIVGVLIEKDYTRMFIMRRVDESTQGDVEFCEVFNDGKVIVLKKYPYAYAKLLSGVMFNYLTTGQPL